jgi:octopine/nopaline transport system substrate-binding protein
MLLPRFIRRRCLLAVPIALTAMFVAGAAGAKEWKEVHIATEGAYPPWNQMGPDGKIVGFEPDLAAVLCKHMNVTCTFIATDWDGVIPGLTAGKYDAIMDGMSVTPKRLEVIAFSTPYAQSPSTFATAKSGPLASLPEKGVRINLAKDPDAANKVIAELKPLLKGKTIGVQVATIQADFLNTYFKDVATIRAYRTTEERDLDLNSDRIDAVLDSMAYLVPGLTKPQMKDVTLAGPVVTGGLFGIGSGVGLRKADPELKALFDDAVKAAIADGTVKTLSMKWFKFDVTPQ